MAKDETTNKIVQLTIAGLLVAVLSWTAILILFDAEEYTVTVETFTSDNLTYVDLTNTQDLIASGEEVYNATSGVILADGGTNYTMNNTDGSIQVNCTSHYMEDAAEYSIQYHQGAVDSSAATISNLLVGIVFFIAIIVILLKHAGIKVN